MEYSIQELARLSGVTTRTLRWYDQIGLLKPSRVAESGYRYYGFDQSARILQYMRLRNYGISVKEMGPFLEGGLDEAVGCLDAKVDEMRAQIERMQAEAAEEKAETAEEPAEEAVQEASAETENAEDTGSEEQAAE